MEFKVDLTPHFDDVFKYIGSYNRHFTISFFILSLVYISSGLDAVAVIFLLPNIVHWCRVEELDNRCVEIGLNEYDCQQMKSKYRHHDDNSTTINEEYCNQYNFTAYDFVSNSSFKNTPTLYCQNGFEYDNSLYQTSVTEEFDLVCENTYLISLSLSLEYAGLLIGSLIIGNIGDRYGRKPTTVVCMLLWSIVCVGTMAAQSYWMYTIFRLLSAICATGVYTTVFVYGCELVSPSKRSLAGSFLNFQWAIGYTLASFFAYMIQNWRYRLLAMLVIHALICVLICM
ncbi:organic cation transporter-like protein isoform X2 [Antedon mediterranea]|uniref:organic cation transporter-like protein isoform X2 n=1 Tax=Antedon mediterranea TaxID=105859 RepID=UPI003AF4160B